MASQRALRSDTITRSQSSASDSDTSALPMTVAMMRQHQARLKSQPTRTSAQRLAEDPDDDVDVFNEVDSSGTYLHAAAQSNARSRSIRSGYAVPEVIDAILFFQHLLSKDDESCRSRARTYMRTDLSIPSSWKHLEEIVTKQMQKHIKEETQSWKQKIATYEQKYQEMQHSRLERYIQELQRDGARWKERSLNLQNRMKRFQLHFEGTTRNNEVNGGVNISAGELQGRTDDELIVLAFRLLRKPKYSYKQQSSLSFAEAIEHELGIKNTRNYVFDFEELAPCKAAVAHSSSMLQNKSGQSRQAERQSGKRPCEANHKDEPPHKKQLQDRRQF